MRKELGGLRPDQPAPAEFGEGVYRPAATAATYAEMLRRTEVALGLAVAEDPWPAATIVDTSAGPADALAKVLTLVGRPGG